MTRISHGITSSVIGLGGVRRSARYRGRSPLLDLSSLAGVKTGVKLLNAPTGDDGERFRNTVNNGTKRNRMGGRVVEGSSLENCRTLARTVGSNPTPSALEGASGLVVAPDREGHLDRFGRNEPDPGAAGRVELAGLLAAEAESEEAVAAQKTDRADHPVGLVPLGIGVIHFDHEAVRIVHRSA